MILNSVNNNQPTFGMALVKPKNRKAMESFAKTIGTASDDFITRITARRGLRQVIKENLGNHFNITYIPEENGFKVKGRREDITFSEVPTTEAKNKLQEMGRKMIRGFNILFNPKGELPQSLKQASKHAKSEYKEELAEAAKKDKKEKRFNKAVDKTDEIFEKLKL